MKIIIKKTDWMRPYQLAQILGTSKQHINNMINTGRVDSKKDRYGITLVRGR